MQGRDKECVGVLQLAQDVRADIGHDAHGCHHVGGVGDLHTKLGILGVERAHDKRNDEHGASAHAAGELVVEDFLHGRRIHPIVGESGVALIFRANEGSSLDSGHILGVREGCKGIGEEFGVQTGKSPLSHQMVSEQGIFLHGPIHPANMIRQGESCYFANPSGEPLVGGHCLLNDFLHWRVAHFVSLHRMGRWYLKARGRNRAILGMGHGMYPTAQGAIPLFSGVFPHCYSQHM